MIKTQHEKNFRNQGNGQAFSGRKLFGEKKNQGRDAKVNQIKKGHLGIGKTILDKPKGHKAPANTDRQKKDQEERVDSQKNRANFH